MKDIEWIEVERKLNIFSQLINKNYIFFVAGMGGVAKEVYLELEEKGTELMRLERYVPNSLIQKVVASFLPSYWGVIKVLDISHIVDIFDKLTDQAMGELYIINHSDELNFVSKIT